MNIEIKNFTYTIKDKTFVFPTLLEALLSLQCNYETLWNETTDKLSLITEIKTKLVLNNQVDNESILIMNEKKFVHNIRTFNDSKYQFKREL